MNILYLMTEPYGIGGVQSDMLALSRLNNLGHKMYVATTPGDMVGELESKGTTFLNIDFNVKDPFQFMKTMSSLRQAIRKHKIDVLAPQSIKTTLASYISLRLVPFLYKVEKTGKPIPIVTTIHNIHNPRNFKYAGKILNRCTDYVIYESNYERDRCISNGLIPAKSCVINSGIDIDKFIQNDPDKSLLDSYNLDKSTHTIFGIVARLSEEKGHNYLLEAFGKVLSAGHKAKLLIVGNGPLEEEVKEYCKKLNLCDDVIFAGRRRDIVEHLSILDVFVLSSTRESFPLAAREAMAAGRAVIAPNIGGCPEVVDDQVTGLLFESANSDDLCKKMINMIEDRNYQKYGKASREKAVAKYSIDSWVKGDEDVYQRYW